MRLNSILCTYGLFVCLILKNVYSIYLPIFKGIVFNLFIELYKKQQQKNPVQSRLTLCSSIDCSPPGSSVHRIFQARILEQVAISFSRGSSQPRDWIWVCCIEGIFFTIWATRVALVSWLDYLYILILIFYPIHSV